MPYTRHCKQCGATHIPPTGKKCRRPPLPGYPQMLAPAPIPEPAAIPEPATIPESEPKVAAANAATPQPEAPAGGAAA